MTKIGTRNDMVENARHDMKRTVPEDRKRTLEMTNTGRLDMTWSVIVISRLCTPWRQSEPIAKTWDTCYTRRGT